MTLKTIRHIQRLVLALTYKRTNVRVCTRVWSLPGCIFCVVSSSTTIHDMTCKFQFTRSISFMAGIFSYATLKLILCTQRYSAFAVFLCLIFCYILILFSLFVLVGVYLVLPINAVHFDLKLTWVSVSSSSKRLQFALTKFKTMTLHGFDEL